MGDVFDFSATGKRERFSLDCHAIPCTGPQHGFRFEPRPVQIRPRMFCTACCAMRRAKSRGRSIRSDQVGWTHGTRILQTFASTIRSSAQGIAAQLNALVQGGPIIQPSIFLS